MLPECISKQLENTRYRCDQPKPPLTKSLGLCPPNRYEIDLSNEVLKIYFGQGAAKIPEVKSGVRKKYLPTRLTPATRVRTRLIGRYFSRTPTLTFGIFAAP